MTARDRGRPQVVSGRNCLRDVYFCRSLRTLNHRQNCGSRCETNIVSDEKRRDELEFFLLYASPPVYAGCSVSANVRRRGYISKNAPRRGLDEMSTSQDWQTRWDLAQRAGLRIGLWNWDLAANTVIWSDESYRQWGFTRQTFSGRVEDALTRVHPDDRPVVEEAIRAVHGETRYRLPQIKLDGH